VLFPEPEAPMMTQVSPRSTVRLNVEDDLLVVAFHEVLHVDERERFGGRRAHAALSNGGRRERARGQRFTKGSGKPTNHAVIARA
jgi:hypothetical protein